MLTLWSDTIKHLRKNTGYVLGYVGCSAVVGATYRVCNAILGVTGEAQGTPAWMPFYRVASLLWLAVGASVCAAAFFSLIGRRVDYPLWKCRDWREGVRRFFFPWMILNLCQIVVIEGMRRLNQAEIQGPIGMLLMVHLALLAIWIPAGACVMYWGRLDWGQLFSALEPILGQFVLVMPVLFIGVAQWLLIYSAPDVLPQATGWGIMWLGLYDAVLDFITCFAFIMMWRVCMIHRDRSIEGGGNPFDF